MTESNDWLEYMEKTGKLPVNKYLKLTKCLLSNMKATERKKLLAKWVYGYNRMVLNEEGIKTISAYYNFAKNYSNIYKMVPLTAYISGPGQLKKFKEFARKKGIPVNLDNYLHFLAVETTKYILDNPFYFDEYNPELGEGWIDYVLMQVLDMAKKILLDEKNREAINVINHYIGKAQTYGIHSERVPSGNFCVIFWSNSSERWSIDRMTNEYIRGYDMSIFGEIKDKNKKPVRRKIVKLDANQVLVPLPCSRVRKVICFIEPLPLYAYSTEFKKRYIPQGEWEQNTSDWAIRQLSGRIKAIISASTTK